MCYAKPGPRCSKHALDALQKAIRSGNEESIKEAKKQFALTPKGIAMAKERGDEELAARLQDQRNRMIAEYTANLEFNELYSQLGSRLSSEEFQELRVARTQAVDAYEQLDKELQEMKKDRTTEFDDLRAKKFEVREAYFNMLEAKDNLSGYKDETAHLVARMVNSGDFDTPEYQGDTLGNTVKVATYQPNTREWLKQRQEGIGGSDIGAILKLDPKYGRSNYEEVLESKLRDYDSMEDDEFTPTLSNEDDIVEGAMQRGDAWEPMLVATFGSRHPELSLMHTKSTWRHKDDPDMLINVDGLTSSNGKNPDGILEIKTGADAREWETGVPSGYRAQVLWYLEATGFDHAHVVAQIDDKEYREYRITRGESIAEGVGSISQNRAKIEDFKAEVANKRQGLFQRTSRDAHPEIKPTNSGNSPVKLLSALGAGDEETVSRNLKARTDNGMSYDQAVRAEFKDLKNKDAGEKVYLDLETTGFSDTNNEIIEIGWSRRDNNNQVLEEGSMTFKPDDRFMRARGTGASDVHGIQPSEVADSPSFRDPEVQQKLGSLLNGRTLVAHNAPFERRFLEQNLDGFRESSPRFVDTQLVSKYFTSGTTDNTLKSFTRSQGVEYKGEHRALADTQMTADALHSAIRNT